MPSIPNLGIKNIEPVRADAWLIKPPVVKNIDVPVTVNIGTPVVLLPGCVNTHSLSNKSKTILQDDSNGAKIFCDANTPAFTPLDYDPGYKFPEPKPAPVPPYKNPDAQKSNESIVNPERKPAGIPSHIPTAANKKEEKIFKSKKISTKNTHGTGCTLSSAIATYFSCGKTLKKSCGMAINYVNHSIGTGPKYGKGHGPINHISVININKNFK